MSHRAPRALVAAVAALVLAGCVTPREQALRRTFPGRLLPDPALGVSYRVYRGDTGEETSLEEVIARAAGADAIFFGEHHYEEVGNAVCAELYQHVVAQRRPVALAMEFFTRDDQEALDAYVAGRTDEEAFREATSKGRRYLLSHRPLIELSRASRTPVIGVGIGRSKWSAWRTSGIDDYAEWRATLSEEERASFPRECERIRDAYWEAILAFSHGEEDDGEDPDPEKAAEERRAKWDAFKTQSLWDDSFAEGMADVRAAEPRRRVFLVVGAFHIQRGLGTLTKYRRRRPADRVLTVSLSRAAEPGTDLSFRQEDRGLADYVLVTVVPPPEPRPDPPADPSPPETEAGTDAAEEPGEEASRS